VAKSNAVFQTPALGQESEDQDLSFECDDASDGSSLELVETKNFPLSAKISSLLFVSTRPLSLQALTKAARCSEDAALTALETVKSNFNEEVHGIELQEIAGNWEFRTASAAKNAIHRMIPPKARKLSRAAAETLAVVAYKQPVQRAEIEAIRGVDALPTLKTLLDARLIRIVGRESSPGHPALYGTTQMFLEKFGLQDLSELPTPAEIESLLDEPGEVEENLEVTDEDASIEELSAEIVSEETTDEEKASE